MENDQNIVKKTCRELGITQKELAARIKVDETSVSRWARGATPIPDWAGVMFDLLLVERQRNIAKAKIDDLQTILAKNP